jgi:cytochrome c oxidase assembly protein subunit 15
MRSTRLSRIALGALAYNVAVILWGAFVRATGSGAGCGAHWPLCNGEVVPHAPSVATLIELTHRITSGGALLIAAGLYLAARRDSEPGSAVRRAAAWVVFFECMEALVGASIVLLRYVGQDASAPRAIWVGAHLANTFFLLLWLVRTVLRASDLPPAIDPSPTRQHLVRLALALSLLVGAAGAITALGDTLFPASSLAGGLAADASPTAHFLVRLRVVHPVLATLTAIVLAGIAGVVLLERPSPLVRAAARAVVVTQLAQITAGVVNLLLLAPIAMQMLHLFLADLTWVALFVLADRWLAEPARAPHVSRPVEG